MTHFINLLTGRVVQKKSIPKGFRVSENGIDLVPTTTAYDNTILYINGRYYYADSTYFKIWKIEANITYGSKTWFDIHGPPEDILEYPNTFRLVEALNIRVIFNPATCTLISTMVLLTPEFNRKFRYTHNRLIPYRLEQYKIHNGTFWRDNIIAAKNIRPNNMLYAKLKVFPNDCANVIGSFLNIVDRFMFKSVLEGRYIDEQHIVPTLLSSFPSNLEEYTDTIGRCKDKEWLEYWFRELPDLTKPWTHINEDAELFISVRAASRWTTRQTRQIYDSSKIFKALFMYISDEIRQELILSCDKEITYHKFVTMHDEFMSLLYQHCIKNNINMLKQFHHTSDKLDRACILYQDDVVFINTYFMAIDKLAADEIQYLIDYIMMRRNYSLTRMIITLIDSSNLHKDTSSLLLFHTTLVEQNILVVNPLMITEHLHIIL
jgi:hypothetical protein